MFDRHTVTFQEVLDIVELLPEDQQENLIEITRRRLIEHKREILAEHIKEAKEDYMQGEVHRGSIDDLIKEVGGGQLKSIQR